MNIQGNLVVEKLIDLSSFRDRDAKRRRLFILADGERTCDELYLLAGVEKEIGLLIIKQLLEDGYLGAKGRPGELETIKAATGSPGKAVLTNTVIEQVTKALAHYLGPVAPLLVNKKLHAGQTLTNTDCQEILDFFGSRLDTDNDRQSFFNTVSPLIIGQLEEVYPEVQSNQEDKDSEIIKTASGSLNKTVLTSTMIAQVTEALAYYLGPVAPLLVNKKLHAGQTLTNTELKEVLEFFSSKLETSSDRRNFLGKFRSIF